MSDPEIIGQKIREVRQMNKKEMEAEGWHRPATVVILANGVKLYPSQDDEGNGPGALFGRDTKGDGFAL